MSRYEQVSNTSISEIIRTRIKTVGSRFNCNDNISKFMLEGEQEKLVDEVTGKVESLLQSLIIDTENDHNTQDTARRVAKMFVNETFSGRYVAEPKVTTFPNASSYDQLYMVGPIDVRSTCGHHFCPIVGKAFIGVYPGKNVVGLSKFNRVVDWIASRPTIQEELTVQIADKILEMTQAEGLAVVIKAEHMCMTHRGVKAHESDMITSVLRGSLRDDIDLRNEFFSLLQGVKGFKS